MNTHKQLVTKAIIKVLDELSEESLTNALAYLRKLKKEEEQNDDATITFKSMVEDFSFLKSKKYRK